MKLLFDLIATQSVDGIKNHGGSEYTKVVFYKLLDTISQDVIIHVIYNKLQLLDEKIKELCTENSIKIIAINSLAGITSILEQGKYNKFFSGLGYSHRKLNIPQNTEFLSVVHGLRPLEMPTDKYEIYFLKTLKQKFRWLVKLFFGTLYLKYRIYDYKKFLLKYNKNIVVVSNHTKSSLLSFFPDVDLKDVNIFYSPEKITPKINLLTIVKKKYFLMISASVWLKNAFRGVSALDNLFSKEEYKDYYAIVLGGLPDKIKSQIKNIDNFKFKGYVSNNELEKLYAEAYFLFYPSLNEGFGYPPLEAMKYGTPVITSAITSIPEVCGDAALYFNPFSIEDMTVKLKSLSKIDYSLMEKKSKKQQKIISIKQDKDLKKLIDWILE